MADDTTTRELTHLLRNLDSLVRLRMAVGDTEEEVTQLLMERGADDYLIALLIPSAPLGKRIKQIQEESLKLRMRAHVAIRESETHRQTLKRLLTEQRAVRQDIRKKLLN